MAANENPSVLFYAHNFAASLCINRDIITSLYYGEIKCARGTFWFEAKGLAG